MTVHASQIGPRSEGNKQTPQHLIATDELARAAARQPQSGDAETIQMRDNVAPRICVDDAEKVTLSVGRRRLGGMRLGRLREKST